MIRQKPLPCLNNPSRVICFLIFAIGRFVTGAVVGNKDNSQPVFARFNDFYLVFLAFVNDVATFLGHAPLTTRAQSH